MSLTMLCGKKDGVDLANLRMLRAPLASVLLGLLLLVPGAPSYAEKSSETRHAALIVDANTGTVLYEQFADAKRHPASLTKMMTLYLVFEEIEQGRLSYTTKLSVSAKAASVAPSKLDLEPGEEIDVIDAIKALITKSANDMAVALAEQIGGTEAGFVRMMNERARQIGMRSTTFTNASGLPDTRQITTARDMVTLALHLQDDFPRHYPLFAMKSFEFRGKTYRTHNTLLYGFPGMDGIKTGYTRASGFNLVSSVKTGKKHLVGAVFGGVTASARNAHMRMQLFRALPKASSERTRRAGPQLVARTAPAKKPASEIAKTIWRTEADNPAYKGTTGAPAKLEPVAQATPKPPVAPVPNNAPEVTRSAAAGPGIDMVKVRTVAITAQGNPEVAAPANTSAPATIAPPPAAAPAPRLDLQALREAISAEASAGTAPNAAAAPASAPASIEDLISDAPLAAPPPPGQKLALADDAPPIAPHPSMGLGRQPSTLDAQAAAIGSPLDQRPEAAAAAPLNPSPQGAPARFAAAPAGRGYEIQIGAYSTAEEAESRMATARSKATGLLEGHKSLALPVQKADRKIFRARFIGFNEDAAENACLELRRLAIDCFVMKAE